MIKFTFKITKELAEQWITLILLIDDSLASNTQANI